MINLLMNREEATVGNSAEIVTIECNKYETVKENTTFYITDTVSIFCYTRNTIIDENAVEKWITFIISLAGGCSLIILVVQPGRISHTLQKYYSLLYETIYRGEVPCILYVSHCEEREPMNEWFLKNQRQFDIIKFETAICGTTWSSARFKDIAEGLRIQTREALWEAIEKYSLSTDVSVKKIVNWSQWLINPVRQLFRRPSTKKEKLIESLCRHGFDETVIKEIIEIVQ